MNSKTGQLDIEDTIYRPDFHPELRIGEKHKPHSSNQDREYVIVSRGGKQVELSGKVHQKYHNLQGCNFQYCWKFTEGRGAILFLIKPVEVTINNVASLLPQLQESLANKLLITTVYECPCYALLFTDEANAEATLGFNLDVGPGLGLTSASQLVYHSSSGAWRTGGGNVSLSAPAVYYPLVTLRTPKPRRFWSLFRSGDLAEGAETFDPYTPPWGELDDNGQEIADESDDEIQDNNEDDKRRSGATSN